MNLLALHKKKVKEISSQIENFSKNNTQKKIRFTHGSTNSTRVQDKSNSYLINISELNAIINIDKKKRIALVEPNVPMDDLVKSCLKSGLIPKVVMEFPGITCGGAVNGAALEASSFKYGQFNDACSEYEVILGDGEITSVNRKKNSDLFYGISGSYGSFALITLITIELIPTKEFVSVHLTPVKTESLIKNITKAIKTKKDFIEGLVLDKKNSLLITGEFYEKLDKPLKTFSKATDDWFITFVKQQITTESQILVPVKDYLFRYNRGAFWMGEHAFSLFHIPNNKFTRFILNPFMNTRTMYRGLHDTNIAQTFFIQDFYIPLSQTNKFLTDCFDKLPISPLWLCPIKSTRKPQYLSPHYLNESMLIDVGIWGPLSVSKSETNKINILFEKLVKKYNGRKMFYAESFYSETEFWRIYDKDWYFSLRKKYKAEGIFATMWEKVTVKKRYSVNKKRILKTIAETVMNKKKVI